MTRPVRLFLALLVMAGAAAVAAQGPPHATRTFLSPADYMPDPTKLATATSELRDLVVRFGGDRAAILRFYTIPGSATRRSRMRIFYDAWLKTLTAVNFDKLSQEGRVDYVLLRTKIDYEAALVAREDRVQLTIAPLLPFETDIVALAENRQRLDFIKADAAVQALTAISAKVSAANASAAPGSGISAATAVRAAQEVDTLNGAITTWFNFFNGYDPAFTTAVPAPYRALSQSLTTYAATLREKLAGLPRGAGQTANGRGGSDGGGGGRGGRGGGTADGAPAVRASEGPIVGDPIGREGLFEDLRGEMIAYTPEQLIAIGNKEAEWSEAEMKKASRDMGFGDDWKKALEKVKSTYVPRGEQPQMVRDLALQAISFVKQHDLVTVPPLAEDQWRMTMMTPAGMRVAPYFLGGETIQVSYPHDSMSEEDNLMVMRANGPHLSHATVFHELIPGHELQGFMAQRYNSHRGLFRTPFLIEGWALYWEYVMWDQGFQATPEDRVGALFWRLHRSARIVFSLNFHLGRWTPEQCVQYLIDQVGHDRFTAEGEVRRSLNGSYSPLYQVAYMMGAVQIRAMMRELVDSKKMTLKQFNDAFLHEGEMPIEMMRAALEDKPLTRNYIPNWQYYGDIQPARP
jgi:Bacterial protein of unknown function (DUF885)